MTLLRKRRSDLIGVAILIAFIVVFPLLGTGTMVNVGVYAMIYAIAAIGLTLLMGLAGQVSLGHAAFFAIGAYTQAALVTKYQWALVPAAAVSVVLAMVAALIVGLPLLRLRGHYLALATLGLGIIVSVLATESDYLGATSGLYGIPKPSFGGRTYDSPEEYFWLLGPIVVLGILFARNIVQSRIGRGLSAVNDSEVAAECLGVDTYRLRVQVFVLSAGYAGLAGVFFAHWLAVVNPNAANFPLSVKFLLISVLGGLGTVWGAIIGAFAVELLDSGLRSLIPVLVPGAAGEVELLGFGLVLTALIIFLPGGLHEAYVKIVNRLRGTRAPEAATATGAVGLGDAAGGATSGGSTPPSAAPVGSAGPVSDDSPFRKSAPESASERSAPDRSAPDESPLLTREGRPEPGTHLLEAEGLTKHFGGVVAVDGVNAELRAGKILALIGPNGAGKTTCFNMISGVLAPTAGTVRIGGVRVDGQKPHVFAQNRATRTFQNLQVFRSSTVLGNVMVGRHLRSKAGLLRGALAFPAAREEREIEEKAREIVDLVGLGDVADRPAADLPFGRQRLMEVARALAMEPDLVLLDEPMAGLSGEERRELARLLRRLRAGGMAIVLVEHDVEAVLALADRVAVLDDGKMIAFGTPEEIRTDPAVIAAYLGVEEQDSDVARLAHTDEGSAEQAQAYPGPHPEAAHTGEVRRES